MTLQEMTEQMQALQGRIENDVDGSTITVKINVFDVAGCDIVGWCSVYAQDELLFTVNTLKQWDSIYNAFDNLFSGPTSQEIAAMETVYTSK